MLWLIGQILVCLLLAGLLGLLLGWLIWGRQTTERVVRTDTEALDRASARIADLERELADSRTEAHVVAAPGATAPTPAPSPTPPPADAGDTSGASAASGAYGLFGPVSDTTVDDLKAISGIGPTIEQQLAGIGVTTYRQIAGFDVDDILRVQEAIDFFPGRIEREGWVEQAARLHRETYGTEP